MDLNFNEVEYVKRIMEIGLGIETLDNRYSFFLRYSGHVTALTVEVIKDWSINKCKQDSIFLNDLYLEAEKDTILELEKTKEDLLSLYKTIAKQKEDNNE